SIFTSPTEPIPHILSLHDALPICYPAGGRGNPHQPGHLSDRRSLEEAVHLRRTEPEGAARHHPQLDQGQVRQVNPAPPPPAARRSEEHTSELQSRENLVCRLLLEK